MKKQLLLFTAVLLLFVSACKKDDITNENWLVPIAEIFDGGPGKDGIPSVDEPQFSAMADIDFMREDDLIIGVKVGTEIRGYPHPILDWHEIINDKIGNLGVAVTYCPLTGTGIGWNRMVAGKETTFGVSGLLYNSNLIPYDRDSDSNWSQMRLECINGNLSGDTPDLVPLIETTWTTWKEMFPDAKVVNKETGASRSYGSYPYGNYKNNEELLFSVTPNDDRLPRKERVLGVFVDGKTKAYPFSGFDFASNTRALFTDRFNGQELLLVGGEEENFIAAFQLNASIGAFSVLPAGGAALFQDDAGNQYDLFGSVISGDGADLVPMESFIGYWFSWGAFYPGTEIFNR